MRHCYNQDTRDTENLDPITVAFVDVFSVLRRRAITPSIFTAEPLRWKAKKEESMEDHFLKFLLRCLRNFED